MFAWLRPNDLVWNYVVNNYLLGKEPPAFDILYWNQDSVRLAAGLHRDFVRIALDNALPRPGAMRCSARRSISGASTSTATSSRAQRPHRPVGERVPQHAAVRRLEALRPLDERPHPGADQPARAGEPLELPRRRGLPRERAESWAGQADDQAGSWWPDYASWLAERAGERKPARKTLGNAKYKPTAKAPGSYVHAS